MVLQLSGPIGNSDRLRRKTTSLDSTSRQNSVQNMGKLKDLASRDFPPQFAELIRLTRSPFVQAISDVLSPQASHYDGRVVLVGDALAGFRPHTAGATSQAAFHGSQLWTHMKTWNEWMTKKSAYEDLVMKFAKHGVQHGQQLGYRSHSDITNSTER